MSSIKERLEKVIPNLRVDYQKTQLKLKINNGEALIKLEINQGIRGIINKPVPMELCDKAQETFDVYCVINSVPFGQLYGGKICAALDRQHPRDLFDVKDLLENEGFTDDIKTGFLFTLLSSKRPIQEILFPNFIDQRQAFTNQFQGMTEVSFTYKDFEKTREELYTILHQSLTKEDKAFILSFEETTPDWAIYDFREYPAVKWKLQNLTRLKETNLEKHNEGIISLKEKLDI